MAGTYSSQSFDLYELSKKLVLACYALTANLPPEEKTALSLYIRQAALKVHLAVAQGAFHQPEKARRKFLSRAKNALVVIDAATDVLVETGLATTADIAEVAELSAACYNVLHRWKTAN